MNAYQLFSQAAAKRRSYDTLIIGVKETADLLIKGKMYSFEALYNCAVTQEWLWTIPGIYEKAVICSLNRVLAGLAVDKWLEPLEFSSSCGLPMAIKPDEIVILRKKMSEWVDRGANLSEEISSLHERELRQHILNNACNVSLAIESITNSVKDELARLGWTRILAYEHALKPEVLDEIERAILRSRCTGGSVCVHNQLVDSSGPDDWCFVCRG
jgi:hypothetical protein